MGEYRSEDSIIIDRKESGVGVMEQIELDHVDGVLVNMALNRLVT